MSEQQATDHDVAYQGAPGAYSEEAAERLCGPALRLLPCRRLADVFDAVIGHQARQGVVPVENTLAGTVPGAYELLLSRDTHVVGETRVRIDHVLIGPRGMQAQDVRRVLSHPVALDQCGDFLRARPEMQPVPAFDTAGAVEMVMRENDGATAAIASRRAAHVYGAVVLAEHLQDHPENWTRFLLIAPGEAAASPPAGAKTLLAFDLAHRPGALVAALQPLAAGRVNLTKIESRPITGRPFEYRFIVELTSEDAGTLQAVVAEMRTQVSWLKVLGTWPGAPQRGGSWHND